MWGETVGHGNTAHPPTRHQCESADETLPIADSSSVGMYLKYEVHAEAFGFSSLPCYSPGTSPSLPLSSFPPSPWACFRRWSLLLPVLCFYVLSRVIRQAGSTTELEFDHLIVVYIDCMNKE